MHHLEAYPTNHHQICMRGASLFVQRFGTESIDKWYGVFLLLSVVGAVSITSYPMILQALRLLKRSKLHLYIIIIKRFLLYFS